MHPWLRSSNVNKRRIVVLSRDPSIHGSFGGRFVEDMHQKSTTVLNLCNYLYSPVYERHIISTGRSIKNLPESNQYVYLYHIKIFNSRHAKAKDHNSLFPFLYVSYVMRILDMGVLVFNGLYHEKIVRYVSRCEIQSVGLFVY